MLNYFAKILFVVCSLLTLDLIAQNPDIKRTYHWYFGINAGLDFSSGSAVAVTNGQLVSDNSASISDTAGNLLFYTDGKTVWNRNHQQMPNGTGLNGDPYGKEVIVPKPLSDSLYYIFYTLTNAPYYSEYAIVNMKLHGGLGDVIVKNDTLLNDTCAERIAAVKHTNGKDVWVAIQKLFTNHIYCYLITATGIQAPVISSIGLADMHGVCYSQFSASGKKLAVTNNQSQIFDFDAATGILSNPIIFPLNPNNQIDEGIEFSPDETKLYFVRNTPATFPNYPSGSTLLYQANLAAGSPANIISSLTFIDTVIVSTAVGVQRASDKLLYVGRGTGYKLGRINNPNALGSGCNFDSSAVNLLGKTSADGLPAFISSYFYDSTLLAGIKQIPNSSKQIKIYPNPSTGIIHIECADAGCTATNETAEIYISNMLGQAVKQVRIENTDFGIDVSDLPNGIYIIEINTSQYQSKQKLIINK
jgi:hypothetical protein